MIDVETAVMMMTFGIIGGCLFLVYITVNHLQHSPMKKMVGLTVRTTDSDEYVNQWKLKSRYIMGGWFLLVITLVFYLWFVSTYRNTTYNNVTTIERPL